MPADLAELARYARFRGDPIAQPEHGLVTFLCDAGGSFQIWRQPLSGGPAYPDPQWASGHVRSLGATPGTGRLAVLADRGGTGRAELYVQSGPESAPVRLTSNSEHSYQLGVHPFSATGRFLAFASSTGTGGTRVQVIDLFTRERSVLLEGGYFRPVRWSADGEHLAVVEFCSNADQCIWLVATRSGERQLLNPHQGEQAWVLGPWMPNGRDLVAITALDREFRGLVRLGPGHTPAWLLPSSCDVEAVAALSPDLLCYVTNERGFSQVRLLFSGDGPAPDVSGPPKGVIASGLWTDAGHLSCMWQSATSPPAIGMLQGGHGQCPGGLTWRTLEPPLPPPVAADRLISPVEVIVPGPEGGIPAWLYKPARARSGKPVPVVVVIHGGPEAQERPSYHPLYQYLVQQQIGVLAPNIRGSTGYGRRYQRRIYGDWGGGDLRDVVACTEFLRTLSWVDSSRIGITGASYGGFIALSAAARFPDRFAAVVDMSGPANLLTFAAAAPPSWRPMLTQLLGDPETDALRLRERSPLTYLDHLRAPLLVIQGAMDRRVPRAESEAVVERLRLRGHPVEYHLFPDEGHVFNRPENLLSAWRMVADFLCRQLGG